MYREIDSVKYLVDKYIKQSSPQQHFGVQLHGLDVAYMDTKR